VEPVDENLLLATGLKAGLFLLRKAKLPASGPTPSGFPYRPQPASSTATIPDSRMSMAWTPMTLGTALRVALSAMPGPINC